MSHRSDTHPIITTVIQQRRKYGNKYNNVNIIMLSKYGNSHNVDYILFTTAVISTFTVCT